jgi:CRP-like cAMP-binding protein
MKRYFSATGADAAPPLSGPGYIYRQLRRVGLSDIAARTVQPRLRPHSYETGTPVWKRGGSIDGWTLVVSGMVGKSIDAGKGNAASLGIYGQGVWFGEQAILSGRPSMADYICLVDTDLLTLPKTVVEALLKTDQAFGEHMAKLVSRRLVTSSEALALHKTGTSCAKVIIGLAQLAGELTSELEEQRADRAFVPIPQGSLASICGVSRTVFSNFVLQLERQGWIELSYGGVEFLRLANWLKLLDAQQANVRINAMGSIEQILGAVPSGGALA